MFETAYFASSATLLMGFAAGLAFGFLLQKAWVTRFDVIVGQFLLRDFTVMKVMLTAIIVGAIGVYTMLSYGWIDGLSIKKATLAANIVGAGIFAVGMVILGYCPGTAVGAIGDGARDAVAGVFGMLAGSFLYALLYPYLKDALLGLADEGAVTLVGISGLSPLWLIGAMSILCVGLFLVIERFEASRS